MSAQLGDPALDSYPDLEGFRRQGNWAASNHGGEKWGERYQLSVGESGRQEKSMTEGVHESQKSTPPFGGCGLPNAGKAVRHMGRVTGCQRARRINMFCVIQRPPLPSTPHKKRSLVARPLAVR